MRIFTPEQNIDADAYKFDYRIYYDAFVKKSEMKAIYCSLTTAYVASVSHTDTNISVGREATMSASVQTRSNDVKYKWYIATKPDFEEASLIEGVESSVYRHNFMEAGQYYFFIEYIIDGISCGVSEPLSVEVSE
jgi:hypothetical protein